MYQICVDIKSIFRSVQGLHTCFCYKFKKYNSKYSKNIHNNLWASLFDFLHRYNFRYDVINILKEKHLMSPDNELRKLRHVINFAKGYQISWVSILWSVPIECLNAHQKSTQLWLDIWIEPLAFIRLPHLLFRSENLWLQYSSWRIVTKIPIGKIKWGPLWQYGLWSFQTGGTKLERFLPKNQHTQM